MAKIGAVINSGSGTLLPDEAEARLAEVKQNLESRVAPGLLAIVPGDQVESEIERIAALKIDILVVGGGDGTVSAAAGVAAKSGIILAVLGLGTLNHFAHDLGLPLEPVKAIELLDQLKEKRVDIAEVNGRLFINNASIGLYPKVVRKRDQRMARLGWRKWPAAVAAAVTVLRRLPQMRMILEIGGEQVRYRTPFVFVGNNEYQGSMLSDSKRPSLTDGCLWVCAGRISRITELIGLLFKSSTKSLQKIDALDTKKTTEMVIHLRRRRLTVAIDGENCILDTPLHFKILPKTLRVAVP